MFTFPTDLDFAQALSVAEAAAVLFSQKIVETTGEPAPGAVLVHDPHLALRILQQAARTAGNPRVKAAASVGSPRSPLRRSGVA
jgi:hypothetical protein